MLADAIPANDIARPRSKRRPRALPELSLSPSEERLAHELVEAFMASVLGSLGQVPGGRPR